MIQKKNGLMTMNLVATNRPISRIDLAKVKQMPLQNGINIPANVRENPSLTNASLQHMKAGYKNGGK